jgi:hypothetical protein
MAMKVQTVAAVIGDVVGSRLAADRRMLHSRLVDVLAAVNASARPSDPLHVTVGDEFQGHFPSVGAALAASFEVHVELLPDIDTRFGIGWGEVTVLDVRDATQDGPAWWAARAAIDEVRLLAGKAGFRHVRTGYRSGGGGADLGAVTAALLCRDQLVGSLDGRSQRILKGLVHGVTQADVAAAERISPSAVSQRIRSGGLSVILAAQERLGAVS